MTLKTLKNIDVSGQRVLVRVDFNVPFGKDGSVADTTRLSAAKPTIDHLVSAGAKVILMSHLGRPDPATREDKFKMSRVSSALDDVLGMEVKVLNDCVGMEVKAAVDQMIAGDVILLENTRFYEGEKKNDPEFARQLAELADLFVSDAFGTVHRAHASTVGVADYLPAYAGFLVEREVEAMTPLLETKEGLVMIVGGAKIDTKIGILENFLDKADSFIVGGGLANTFLFAQGHDVGESLCQEDKKAVAQDLLGRSSEGQFLLPRDVIVADDVSDDVTTLDIPVEDVEGDMKILDMGTLALEDFVNAIMKAKTIVWNGPVGLYEFLPFARGTMTLAKAVSMATAQGAVSVLGGGDTVDAINKFGHSFDEYTHVSTGGGAMLEFLEGKTLPGLAVLH